MTEMNCDKCNNKKGCGWYLLGKQPESCECYEEIKQKIKQATEPRLMIDEKGNLKELK